MLWVKQSTAITITVGPILDSTGAEYTGAVIGDLTIRKHDGSGAAMASAATLTHVDNGHYTLVTTTGNTDTLGRLQIRCNKSTYQMPPVEAMVLPAMVFDSLILGTDDLDTNTKKWNDLTTVALPLIPTTAGRTLDVSTGGEAGVDWANVGSPTTTLNLSGTTVKTATDIATATTAIQADTDDIQTRLPAALVSGRMDSSAGAIASGAITAASIAADAITAAKIADGAIDAATFAAGAINAAAIATDAITAAKIAADAIGASELAADAVTEIQSGLATPTNITAGTITTVTTLTNAPPDSSGVTTLLSRLPAGLFTGLTNFAQWLGLIAGKQTGNSTARTEIRATGVGSGTFDETTDSVEAIRDRGDSAWTTATGFSTLTAAQVRDVSNATPAAGSLGEAVNNAASAGDPWSTSLPGSYTSGQAGKIVGDNLNATVNSRASQTSVDTVDDFLDTEIAAIKAKTDGLPSDPADASDIAASFSTVNTTLATIAAYIDTEVAAIKAKTDNLPSDPADASDIAASFTSIASTLTTIAAYIDTEVAAIKAKTDNLPASPANEATLSTIAGYIDTEVAAIKAKTDNLPSDPADESLVIAATDAIAAQVTALTLYASRTVIRGTVGTSTTPSTTQFTPSALSPAGVVASQFVGRVLVFDNDTATAALRGQVTAITASSAASLPLLTFEALTTAPSSGDSFSIL